MRLRIYVHSTESDSIKNRTARPDLQGMRLCAAPLAQSPRISQSMCVCVCHILCTQYYIKHTNIHTCMLACLHAYMIHAYSYTSIYPHVQMYVMQTHHTSVYIHIPLCLYISRVYIDIVYGRFCNHTHTHTLTNTNTQLRACTHTGKGNTRKNGAGGSSRRGRLQHDTWCRC